MEERDTGAPPPRWKETHKHTDQAAEVQQQGTLGAPSKSFVRHRPICRSEAAAGQLSCLCCALARYGGGREVGRTRSSGGHGATVRPILTRPRMSTTQSGACYEDRPAPQFFLPPRRPVKTGVGTLGGGFRVSSRTYYQPHVEFVTVRGCMIDADAPPPAAAALSRRRVAKPRSTATTPSAGKKRAQPTVCDDRVTTVPVTVGSESRAVVEFLSFELPSTSTTL